MFILEDEIDRYPRNQIKEILSPNHTLTIAKSCKEAIKKYRVQDAYDLLLLDHDMEGEYEYRPDYPNTGMQFVKWLVQQRHATLPAIMLHSHNPVGRQNMRTLLEQHEFVCNELPFGQAHVKWCKTL